MTKIDDKTIKNLEKNKNEALNRIAKTLKARKNAQEANSTHSSHSSGSGRTHTSLVTS